MKNPSTTTILSIIIHPLTPFKSWIPQWIQAFIQSQIISKIQHYPNLKMLNQQSHKTKKPNQVSRMKTTFTWKESNNLKTKWKTLSKTINSPLINSSFQSIKLLCLSSQLPTNNFVYPTLYLLTVHKLMKHFQNTTLNLKSTAKNPKVMKSF